MLKQKFLTRVSFMLAIVFVFTGLAAVSIQAREYVPIEERGYAHPESLISCEELREIKDREDVVVVDFRHKVKFATGHIPGALQVFRGDQENPDAEYGGMRATPEQMENLLESIGVSNGDLIVIYDANGDYDASRMWWILTMYGYDNIKLLDGGLTRWKNLGYDLGRFGGPDVQPGDFEFPEGEKDTEKWLATCEDVQACIEDNEDRVILDTRSRAEHTGEEAKGDAPRAGCIPESVWIEWTEAINDGPKTFKTAEELEEIYHSEGVTPDKTIIPYCQSAVRSSHSTFVLTQLLGYENVKNYDGSWIEWSRREDLPIENN